MYAQRVTTSYGRAPYNATVNEIVSREKKNTRNEYDNDNIGFINAYYCKHRRRPQCTAGGCAVNVRTKNNSRQFIYCHYCDLEEAVTHDRAVVAASCCRTAYTLVAFDSTSVRLLQYYYVVLYYYYTSGSIAINVAVVLWSGRALISDKSLGHNMYYDNNNNNIVIMKIYRYNNITRHNILKRAIISCTIHNAFASCLFIFYFYCRSPEITRAQIISRAPFIVFLRVLWWKK